MKSGIFMKEHAENQKWHQNHIQFWGRYLEINNEGFSLFQTKLQSQLNDLLDRNAVEYLTEIKEYKDINGKNKIVKMITVKVNDTNNSKFWIYHDMADFDLNKNHQVFEEWSYLDPEELIEKYLKSTMGILRLI
jgi:cyclophilin family peptidyl-prolyl cis-trans isomerase